MAKRKTPIIRARKEKATPDDDSLLIGSAESLGRVIGSLQRQVRGTSKRQFFVAEAGRGTTKQTPTARKPKATRRRKASSSRKR